MVDYRSPDWETYLKRVEMFAALSAKPVVVPASATVKVKKQ